MSEQNSYELACKACLEAHGIPAEFINNLIFDDSGVSSWELCYADIVEDWGDKDLKTKCQLCPGFLYHAVIGTENWGK